jgi:hypothetical protein
MYIRLKCCNFQRLLRDLHEPCFHQLSATLLQCPLVKRLFHILRAGLTCLSLVLLSASTTLWIRSQSTLDDIEHYRPRRYTCLESVEGRIYYNPWTAALPGPYWNESSTKLGGGDLARMRYAHIPFSRQLGPFAYGHTTSGPNGTVEAAGDVCMFPHWALLLLFTILPALSLRQILKGRRTRARLKNALCIQCGYDIRSTPSRCPECGLENASPAAVAS